MKKHNNSRTQKQVKPKAPKSVTKSKQPVQQEATAPQVAPQPDDEHAAIDITLIDLSPSNYRKKINEAKLKELAVSLGEYGQLENIVVRRHPDIAGRFELAIGERRWRAARIAGLPTLSATIRVLTDLQLREIQLHENMQREDPHPMEEARGFVELVGLGGKPEEIAAKMGKSKSYVYQRLRLAALIEPIAEIFLSDRLNTSEALQIAALSVAGQQAFFDSYCSDWKEAGFSSRNLDSRLNMFRFDLNEAPFDTKDKNLVAGVGACTRCSFNSATLKSLFPEEAKEKTCLNHTCFQAKCNAHSALIYTAAYLEIKPDAVLYYSWQKDLLERLHAAVPETKDLPAFSRYDVHTETMPVSPKKEDYGYEEEGEEDGEEDGFDEEGYLSDCEAYEQELQDYEAALAGGHLQKAMLLDEDGAKLVYFTTEKPQTAAKGPVKLLAKDVAAHVKAKTLTPEIVAAERTRLEEREASKAGKDGLEVQRQLHAAVETATEARGSVTYCPEDRTAAALLIYKGLPYGVQREVDAVFREVQQFDGKEGYTLIDFFQEMEGSLFAWLVRIALLARHESKNPKTDDGKMLEKLATVTWIDVAAIRKPAEEMAAERRTKLEARMKDLEKRLNKQPKALIPATDELEPVTAEELAE